MDASCLKQVAAGLGYHVERSTDGEWYTIVYPSGVREHGSRTEADAWRILYREPLTKFLLEKVCAIKFIMEHTPQDEQLAAIERIINDFDEGAE